MKLLKNILRKPEVVSGLRMIVSFGPTVLAYQFLKGDSEELMLFLRIVSGYSLVATVSTLGLGGYIYALMSSKEYSFCRVEAAINIICIASLLTLAALLILAFVNDKSLYLLLLASSVIIASWSAIQLQMTMAKKKILQVLVIGSVSSLNFLLIVFGLYIYGSSKGLLALSIADGLASIFILKTFLQRRNISIIKVKNIKNVSLQAINGLICSGGPPIVMLLILGMGGKLDSAESFAIYVLYIKLYEGASSYCNSLILVKFFHQLKKPSDMFAPSMLWHFFLGSVALIFLVNVAAFLISGKVLVVISILECVIFLLKLFVSTAGLMILTESPKILIFKEMFIVFGYICLDTFGVESVLGLQLFSISIYAVALYVILRNRLDIKLCRS